MELVDKLQPWFSGKRRLSVLLLCDDNANHANTILDHIAAFVNLSTHRVCIFNPLGLLESSSLHVDEFDVIVIHYSLFIISDHYLAPGFREQIRHFQGLKVQFIQDDYRRIDEMSAMMRYLGIHILFTLYPDTYIPQVWTEARLPGVRKITTLAGYIPDRLVGLTTSPVEARPIDIGYRGRAVPYWLGQFGQEKIWIAEEVLQHADKYGLRCDIAWREADRIYGHDWDAFIGSCQAILGTESGASITDFDGSVERCTQAYLQTHPSAGFWEVHREILAPYEDNVSIKVISPRIFEAIAQRTALILFPGDYSGIVQPWRHYLPLAKDFSNLDEVVEKLRDTAFLQAMTERAYEDVVASERYSYRTFIQDFDIVLMHETVTLAFSQVLPKIMSRLPFANPTFSHGSILDIAEQQNNRQYFNSVLSKKHGLTLSQQDQEKINILILYDDSSTHINTVTDYLTSFSSFSTNNIFYAIATNNTECKADLSLFDVIIIHYSVRLSLKNHLSVSYADAIEKFNGLKLLFIQDEYDTTETARAWIHTLGIRAVFTCVSEEYLNEVYPAARFPGVEFIHILTGYVPIALEQYMTPKPLAERTCLIGYRGRSLPPWYGDLGREKVVIAQKMRQICAARGLQTDIEWAEDKRIYGDGWYTFLEDCKATLGTESGSNVFDYYGSIRYNIEVALQTNPSLTYEEIHRKYLAGHDGKIVMNQISPRIFEAIALKTALILFEGRYSGLIKPDIHYISLKKDFSNIDEVLEKIQDDKYLQQMVDRAHTDIIQSGQYSYRQFVHNIDNFIAQRARKRSHGRFITGLVGSQQTRKSGALQQAFQKTYPIRSIPMNMPLLAAHIPEISPADVQSIELPQRYSMLIEYTTRLEAARADAEARRSQMETHYTELQGLYNTVLQEVARVEMARAETETRCRQGETYYTELQSWYNATLQETERLMTALTEAEACRNWIGMQYMKLQSRYHAVLQHHVPANLRKALGKVVRSCLRFTRRDLRKMGRKV